MTLIHSATAIFLYFDVHSCDLIRQISLISLQFSYAKYQVAYFRVRQPLAHHLVSFMFCFSQCL